MPPEMNWKCVHGHYRSSLGYASAWITRGISSKKWEATIYRNGFRRFSGEFKTLKSAKAWAEEMAQRITGLTVKE